ncbi:MAG TPA: hypothetical protein VMU38_09955 [Candidatus Binatia bacterium]|nr:hypothetical protein [Candidatus Binatia bacterium]
MPAQLSDRLAERLDDLRAINGLSHTDLAEATYPKKSRAWVQQCLGIVPMTVEAAQVLVDAAHVADLMSQHELGLWHSRIAKARPPEATDWRLYVVEGNPLEKIMAAIDDVRLAGKTRRAIRLKIARKLRFILWPTDGDDPQFSVEIRRTKANQDLERGLNAAFGLRAR